MRFLIFALGFLLTGVLCMDSPFDCRIFPFHPTCRGHTGKRASVLLPLRHDLLKVGSDEEPCRNLILLLVSKYTKPHQYKTAESGVNDLIDSCIKAIPTKQDQQTPHILSKMITDHDNSRISLSSHRPSLSNVLNAIVRSGL